MKLNMAILGFGKSATRYHLPYILLRKDINVKWIYNRNRKFELEKDYENCNISFTDNISDVLNDDDVKLVTICTPPSTHYNLANLCLLNNKNVLVEKPFATTLSETKKLLDLANSKGLTIMPYQNRRFDSDFLVLKSVIDHGNLGDIVELESHIDYYRPEDTSNNLDYYNGAVFSLGVHILDQAISLFGRPEKVFYDVKSIRNPANADDYYEIQLFYNTFKVKLKTSHLVKLPYSRFTIHGKKGSFIKRSIDRQEEFLKKGILPETEGFGLDTPDDYGIIDYINDTGEEITQFIKTPSGDYGRVYDSIYSTIMDHKEKLVKDDELLTVIEILEKAFKGDNPKIITL
ncbi:oxidoreductase [Clostridium algidicarnis]|uniref:Oxidoreductase n=1 Tax=Clostridium algidicarnis TaxID=37659 RepID=A0ABS6C4X4_9CLOT|nr:oxidoreductase [Clostridium algidicarnis]MBU3220539.1 oxidoreductase [Clostridium algidicarnis]MCB2286698.1 oxidoreductase [Clostridium algidicarnis]